MTKLPRPRAILWRFTVMTLISMLMACAPPAQPSPSSASVSMNAASPEQPSGTPTHSDTPISPAESAPLTGTAPSPISATITLTESVKIAPVGSKGDKMLLANADTAINQSFAGWLALSGATIADLTPEIRATSPTITVTLILEDETAATNLKDSLPELEAQLLAEAGTMLSIQLPLGYLDQLAQVPGVLLIQTPTAAPPISQNPAALPIVFAPFNNNGSASPLWMQATPNQGDTSTTSEMVAAWANSLPIDWSGLEDVQIAKSNQLPLTDAMMNAAYQNWQATALAAGAELPQAAWSSELITATLVMQDEASAISAKAMLSALNIQLLDSYAEWLVVLSPVGQLKPLMELPGLLLAQQPTPRPPLESAWTDAQPQISEEPADSSAVAVVTEGVARSKINVWHNAGFRGQNVRIAILDSFDQAIINNAFAKKEIPTKVLNGPSEPGANHGIAVAEVVYDMAPQAIISLNSVANGPDFCIAMANALENLAKLGNQIISSSISPVFCPSAGNGATNPLSQAATRVLNTYNTLYVQAAGNNARHHFEKTFKGVEIGENVLNNFAPSGESTVNVLVVDTPSGPAAATIAAGTILHFYLRWDGGWPRSSQDYDMYLVYNDGAKWTFLECALVPCQSTITQDGTQMPYEFIATFAPFTGSYGIVIVKYDADGNHFLDLLASHAQPFLFYNSPNRSLIAAASSQDVFSIAAVDVGSLGLEFYSSRGPTYGPGNSPNGGFAQPRLAAYANVTTYISPGFNGTSSATPHVAGAAAVLKSAATCLSARQLGDFLTKNSLDKGAAGYDFEFGSGVLNFPAVSARPSCVRSKVFIPNILR